MIEIIAIVEGGTEQSFVRDVLAVYLGQREMTIWPNLLGKPGRKGGIRRWEPAKKDIMNVLKGGRYCTTMFDYYALPSDWPGRQKAKDLPYNQRGRCIESAIIEDLVSTFGDSFDSRKFIPYIQIHEFEALLFSDTAILAQTLSGLTRYPTQDKIKSMLDKIVDDAGDPEAINDNYETCPSRRIEGIVELYGKKSTGPIIASKIGISTLSSRCDHFGKWIKQLEDLACTE